CVSNELERTLKHIEDNTKKLSQTISRFQTYFKPDEEITITTFKDIKSVIEEFFHGYFEDKSIKIECNVQDGVNLSTYKDELVNVIFNLVFNSYESLVRQDEKKKIIKITMQEEKDFFTFSVTDNGEPLRSEVKAHMFDPYFSTKEEKNGKGMGLYMAKMIIEKHCKGTITIDDNAFGVTATVKVPNLA
ncbi:MAG: HAMP domain-containing histidine kinase, partial [Thiovulaceae bacterium]|nr:HAMP domain-containing histidine kinase [Sulfurimonadaceae bacterium]